MSRHKKISVSIGIFCHNEETNIHKAIDSILASKTNVAKIKDIVVVSSGSYDNTNKIVRRYEKKDKRIRLVEEPIRRGKSTAINLFLNKIRTDVAVTVSGDLKLKREAIEELVLPFLNDQVGMVGAHPVPTNCRFSQVGAEMSLLWELHHIISLRQPKCGEMVAFRNVIKKIPAESAVDEANLEVLLKLIGFVVVYAPKSIVYNRVPKNFNELMRQRRRVEAGHLWLAEKYNYTVSTMNTNQIFRALVDLVAMEPQKFWPLVRLISFELLAKALGWFDYRVLKKNPFVWDMVSR